VSRLTFAALALLAPFGLHAAGIADLGQHRLDRVGNTKVLAGPPLPGAGAGPASKAAAAPTATAADGVVIEMVTRYTRDAKGRIIRVDYPDGSFRTTEYSPTGKPAKECDALARCVERIYDARDADTEIRYADGTREATAYDPNGNVIARTSRAGRTTKYVYDAADRLTETILPDATPAADDDNPRTRLVYDRAGQVVAHIDARGKRTDISYDAAGRRTSVTDPLGNTTRTEYDAAGRRTATVDALGHRTEYVTDAAGRLIETIYHDGSSIRAEYDAVNQLVAKIDATGKRTAFQYDPLGRLVGVPMAVGTSDAATTTYRFDEVGNKLAQTDAEGRVTRWSHDNAGRVLSRTLPGGQREVMQYDIVGNLIAHKDFNGAITQFGYDAMNRRTSIDYPNSPDVTIEYARGESRPLRVTDGNGTTQYGYGPRGELTALEFPHGESIAYRYDAAGNRTELTTAFQHLRFAYDDVNRLTAVTDDRGTTQFEYDAVGNRTAMLRPNGVRTTYAYDALNRLTGLTHTALSGDLLFSVSYTLNPAGLRIRAEERDASGVLQTVSYTYDALNRLVAESIIHRDAGRTRTSGWSYDKVGNRTAQTLLIGGTLITTHYTYDANDRLLTEVTGSVTTSYTYDANGNTLTRNGPDGLVEYAYDDANRLVEMRSARGRYTYGYDSDGLRISETFLPANDTPVSTFYLLDKSQPFAQVIETHVQEGTGPRRLAATYTFGDDLIAQTSDAGTHYVLADGMGSTRLLVDQSGAVTDTFDFDAFGNELARTGNTSVAHLYRGEQYDPNLGFYYLRARYYDAKTGRFPTMDPFGGFDMDPPSLHKYLYAHADPIQNYDPSGRSILSALGTGIGYALTAWTVYSTIQVVGDFVSGERELSAKEIGIAALWAYAGSKLGPLGGRVVQTLRRSGCLGNSFTGDTLVETEAGPRRIDKIKVGERVLSRNMDTGENELRRVSAVMTSTKLTEIVVLTLETGSIIEATPEHLIFADGEWIQAQALLPGAVLAGADGSVRVSRVARTTREVAVFDLTVEENRNFFVAKDRVLVHNISPCEKAAQAIAKTLPKICTERFHCDDFVVELEKRLIKGVDGKPIKGKRLCVRATRSRYVGSLKHGQVSGNQNHFAVQVGELVFDNLNPDGIPYAEWANDLGVTEDIGVTVTPEEMTGDFNGCIPGK
jgi:RHS repeat-associated protein